MTREVNIEGHEFLVTRFPANGGTDPSRVQWHVGRRIFPFIKGLIPLLASDSAKTLFGPPQQPAANGEAPPNTSQEDAQLADAIAEDRAGIFGAIADGVGALADAFSEMPDAQANYVLDACLSCVKFKTAGGWQNLRASNGRYMFEPAMDLDFQMRLAWEALQENFGSFSLSRLFPPNALTGVEQILSPPAPGTTG